MEDPIDFAVWAVPVPGKLAEQVATLVRIRDIDRSGALKLVSRAKAENQAMVVASRVAWGEVPETLEACSDKFEGMLVVQSDYALEELVSMRRCPIHLVWYGGCLGCPVCEGVAR